MKLCLNKFAVSLLFVLASWTTSEARAAEQCTSDQWGEVKIGEVTFYNNIWGKGPGPQTLCVDSVNAFRVKANHTKGDKGVKAYPNANYNIDKDLNMVKTLTASVEQTTPTDGDWNASFDIWDKDHKYEIMLWLNKSPGAGPIAKTYGADGKGVPDSKGESVGGFTWDVYSGTNGANAVISLVNTAPGNSIKNLNILAVMKWLQTKKYIPCKFPLGQVQYGFEIVETIGEKTYGVSNYTLTHD